MDKYICLSKEINRNKIKYYRLMNMERHPRTMKHDALLKAMQNREVSVINLQVSSDGRIVDRKVSQDRIIKFCTGSDMQQFEKEQRTATIMNYEIQRIIKYWQDEFAEDYNANKMSVVIKSFTDIDKLSIHASDIKPLRTGRIYYGYDRDAHCGYIVSQYRIKLDKCMSDTFSELKLKKLSIIDVDFSDVVKAEGMFRRSTIGDIIVNKLNTKKLTNTSRMFYCAHTSVKAINSFVSNLNTSKLEDTSGMFYHFEFTDASSRHVIGRRTKLDIRNLKSENVKHTEFMLEGTKVDQIIK